MVPTVPGSRPGPAAPSGADRLARFLDIPDARVLVAFLADGTRAGAALLSADVGSVAIGGRTLSVILMVDENARQRGVGREIVTAVARIADDAGMEAVTVSLQPGNREAHRFFARLGFVPLVSSRVASVPQLMRALAPSEVAADRRHSVLLRARRPFGRRSAAVADARMAAGARLDGPAA